MIKVGRKLDACSVAAALRPGRGKAGASSFWGVVATIGLASTYARCLVGDTWRIISQTDQVRI